MLTGGAPARSFSVRRRLPFLLPWAALILILAPAVPAETRAADGWVEAVLSYRPDQTAADATQAYERFALEFPLETDWLLQDLGRERLTAWLEGREGVDALARGLMDTILARSGRDPAAEGVAAVLARYLEFCSARRKERLRVVRRLAPRIVFTRRHHLAGSHYAYTEGQSDAQHERHFRPGSALCLLDLGGGLGVHGTVTTLVDDPGGVIRDPAVSHDGERVLFAWKKADRDDDYHLYELSLGTRVVRQLTFGPGVADYEGAYLPDGRIVFSSTRCVQTVDCWWTEVSNLFVCEADGTGIRRLGYDQVHTNYPQVLADGRVLYTRWEYSDRGQLFPQGLFQMRPDGTGQTEFYGNNSWFPTSLLHARDVPGVPGMVLAIASGHHSSQAGKLVLVDVRRGRQENRGVTLVAPVRDTPAVRIDAYGQAGPLWQHPFALTADDYLVSHLPWGRRNPDDRFEGRFGIYWMHRNGDRELLARDPQLPCSQPVPLVARVPEHRLPEVADPRSDTAVVYLQDVYAGPGLRGVVRGTVSAIRVVGLEYRAAGIGHNENHGPAGGALVSTPVAVGNGTWDPKRVLGEAPVYADGSALFRVPARTPVYFQVLDASGYAVQTMRSWATLQGREAFSCVGCHEPKSSTPDLGPRTQAMAAGVVELTATVPGGDGFSFPRHIQPILDRHCVDCHRDRSLTRRERLAGVYPEGEKRVLSPISADWRYTLDPPAGAWHEPAFDDGDWVAGTAGFGRVGTPGGTVNTDWHTGDVWLRRRFRVPADLPGTAALYLEVCHDEDVEVYLNGRPVLELSGYITDFRIVGLRGNAAGLLSAGTENTLAVHCRQTAGGQFIDLALVGLVCPQAGTGTGERDQGLAFSLLPTPVVDPVAKRAWSESYLELTNAVPRAGEHMWTGVPDPRVNWISAQSVPDMLPPRSAGACRSSLLDMLRGGHHGVDLSDLEFRTLACWIDLLVPFCGDYTEAHAWSEDEIERYARFQRKRAALGHDSGGAGSAAPGAGSH
jgi:hypothetical protein